MSDYPVSQPADGSDAQAAEANLHPKLMTHRRDGDSGRSSARQSPQSARGVPSNEELGASGVSLQDGVVVQLSARQHEPGSLAGPREMPSPTNSSRRRLDAITTGEAGAGVGVPLQLSEPRQRSAITGAARVQQPIQQPRQRSPQKPARHAAPGGATQTPARQGSTREPIRPGRDAVAASPTKHKDPYSHVTSLVHEYCRNHMTAQEAQYKIMRSRSNPHPGRSHDSAAAGEPTSGSPHSNGAAHSGYERPRSPSASFLARQSSPHPRTTEAEYRRAGVPRAALDAPHIRYAEALETINRNRSASMMRRMTPGDAAVQSAPSDFVPDVAVNIPDRFKYVPPTDEERRLKREATMRALDEWRAKHYMSSAASRRSNASITKGAGEGGPRNRTTAKNRARTRSQQPAPSHSALLAAYASPEATQQSSTSTSSGFDGSTTPSPHRQGRRTKKGKSKTGGKRERAKKKPQAALALEEVGEYEPRSNDPQVWPKHALPPPSRRTSTVNTPRNTSGYRRPSTRKVRRAPETLSNTDSGVNPNAYRRKLIFEVTAPTVISV